MTARTCKIVSPTPSQGCVHDTFFNGDLLHALARSGQAVDLGLLGKTRRRIRVWGSGSAARLSCMMHHAFLLSAAAKNDLTGRRAEQK